MEPTTGDTGDTAKRIATAWKELRRGTSSTTLRAHLFGPDGQAIEQAQLDALEVLSGTPSRWRMGDFADALRIDPSTATRAIDRLEKAGFAERLVAETDRRVVHVTITPLGQQLISRIIALRTVGTRRLLDEFDANEREQLAALLERLVVSVDRLVVELAGEQ